MAKMIRSFRFKMIMLLIMSMICSGVLTFALYKMLQLYYKSEVKLEDSLARFRHMIGSVGDLNFFLIFFIPLAILFSSSLPNPMPPISGRFPSIFICWQTAISKAGLLSPRTTSSRTLPQT